MATITFLTKPKKVYYSYKSDGCIYNITTSKPEASSVADGGGVWCCYFDIDPYHQVGGKYYPLYEQNGTDNYVLVKTTSYNNGGKYYYTTDGKTFNQITSISTYYSRDGKTSLPFPKSAAELPQTSYTKDEVSVTYYFDTLITNGGTYNATLTEGDKQHFAPLDNNGTTSTTTFGELIYNMVVNAININTFTKDVNAIPPYLKGTSLETEYKINSIDYTMPAYYLDLYGKIFVDKLLQAMKDTGDKILANYKSTNDDYFKNETINIINGVVADNKEKNGKVVNGSITVQSTNKNK